MVQANNSVEIDEEFKQQVKQMVFMTHTMSDVEFEICFKLCGCVIALNVNEEFLGMGEFPFSANELKTIYINVINHYLDECVLSLDSTSKSMIFNIKKLRDYEIQFNKAHEWFDVCIESFKQIPYFSVEKVNGKLAKIVSNCELGDWKKDEFRFYISWELPVYYHLGPRFELVWLDSNQRRIGGFTTDRNQEIEQLKKHIFVEYKLK